MQLGKATSLRVGVPVYAIGAPQGLELSLSDGIVAQLRGGPPPLIQTTAAISRGSSGGGLFDKEGRLVGLTTLYLEGGQNLNFALPVEWIDEVKPGRKTVTGGRSQTEWWKRAIALEKSKDLHGLLQLFLKWAENEPTNDKAWYNLGTIYSDLKRYNDATEAFQKALPIDSEYAKAWNILGGLCAFTGNRTGALEAVQKLRTLDPERADRLFDLIHRLDGRGKK